MHTQKGQRALETDPQQLASDQATSKLYDDARQATSGCQHLQDAADRLVRGYRRST